MPYMWSFVVHALIYYIVRFSRHNSCFDIAFVPLTNVEHCRATISNSKLQRFARY